MRALCLVLALAAASSAHGAEPLPFIEDDYPRALAQARQRRLPLFVDSWAPWCHTCRFMRAWVLRDGELAKQANRFVWLSIDTERETNAPFLAKYPIEVWPTLMIVDPEREAAVLRWPGSATVSQLVQMLDEGERALRPQRDRATALLARADRLAGENKPKEAAVAYRLALGQVGAAQRPHVVESMLLSLQLAHDALACTQSAMELVPPLPRGPSFANAVAVGLGCAGDLPIGEQQRVSLRALEKLAKEALGLEGLLADDRSGLFEELVAVREQAGDAVGKKVLASSWLEFLESEAAKARSAEARAAFDPHRVLAALAAAQPERAIAPLLQSERDLPNDYNPPARLAVIYGELGRYDDALAACDRALAKAYGPRRLRVLETKANIEERKNDRIAARRTIEEALREANALPFPQRSPARVAQLKARLEKLAK
jgi:hypothetical protein